MGDRPRRLGIATGALGAALALAACGIGPGPSTEGIVHLLVTNDYGAKAVDTAIEKNPTESDTVLRVLDREEKITTRYGGGFVQSINGVGGQLEGGRNFDWFFYVNGVESPQGSAEVRLRGGDRIWWDYRDWTDAMRVPAVVGQWPEPFAQASTPKPKRLPVRIECSPSASSGEGGACARVGSEVRAAVVGEHVDVESGPLAKAPGSGKALSVLVGNASEMEATPELKALAQGPATSGVFARFGEHGSRLEVLPADGGNSKAAFGHGAGLVAALRDGDDPPTWVVSGTDEAGTRLAAEQLDERALARRFALVVSGSATLSAPLRKPELGAAGAGARQGSEK